MGGSSSLFPLFSKKHEIVLFSSTAIALYGYDQGMMSLINTNYSYLRTMQISKESPIVGIIVSVYYLGRTLGAIAASYLADKEGRKLSIFICLATTSFGNILMFTSGLSMSGSSPWNGAAIACMLAGRVIMGLGVGGIDAVIPVYSSELSSDGARGRALAQEFQYWLFLVFAVTNSFAGWWTWKYSPESGGRSFEENQEFFNIAKDDGTWAVRKVDRGKFVRMPKGEKDGEDGEGGDRETSPLLRN